MGAGYCYRFLLLIWQKQKKITLTNKKSTDVDTETVDADLSDMYDFVRN